MRIVTATVRRAVYAGLSAAVLAATPLPSSVGAACTGDCDGDGAVTVNEVATGVRIALGWSALGACPPIDRDAMGNVSITELVDAVNALLAGCANPTPAPSTAANHPPVLPTPSIYRTFSGFAIAVPITAIDPEGGRIRCTVENLPTGAAFDEQSGVLGWTPTIDQIGPFYLPFTCADDAAPPARANGQLIFKVAALDACAIPSCDPATGCTATLPPLDEPCCGSGPAARVAEPVAGCPEGRVLHIGQHAATDGFGRLQNCDAIFVRQMFQAGADVMLHLETRCLNTRDRVRFSARMESTAANHPVIFDVPDYPPFRLTEEPDGFARRRGLRVGVNMPAPFYDIEGAEADLTVVLTDSAGVSVSERLRVRLTFTPRPTDLPDLDPTLPARRAATPTPSSVAGLGTRDA